MAAVMSMKSRGKPSAVVKRAKRAKRTKRAKRAKRA